MKSLIEYTHKIILERRLLKKDIAKYRATIQRLEKSLEDIECIDHSNTKELNRLREEVIKLRNNAS